MDRADHLGEPVSAIVIAPATAADAADWAAMRQDLWPHAADDHGQDISDTLADDTVLALIARVDGVAAGFAEISLRHDYVNGCKTSPVAFLEGIYVAPAWRRRGVAAALVGAAQDWARQKGCSEFASDAALGNTVSHSMHHALGFVETQRVVYFRKVLG